MRDSREPTGEDRVHGGAGDDDDDDDEGFNDEKREERRGFFFSDRKMVILIQTRIKITTTTSERQISPYQSNLNVSLRDRDVITKIRVHVRIHGQLQTSLPSPPS